MKKINILLICLLLTNFSCSFAQDVDKIPVKEGKKIEFFKFSGFKKQASDNNKTDIKKVKADKVQEAKVELPKEVKADKPARFNFKIKKKQELKKAEKPAVQIKNNDTNEKKYFNIFKKNNKKSTQIIQENQAPVIPEKTENAVEYEPKKIEKVQENDAALKVDSKTEIKMNDDKVQNVAIVQGAVASDKIISIDDCVKLALENHPALRSAMGNAEVYKTKIGQAWSNYFPKLSLDANYSRNDMLIANFAFPMQKYGLYNTPRIGADWMLFDFGKTKAQADVARKAYEAAESNVQMNVNDIIYNVKNAYYNLLFALQQEEVYSETVNDFELHLKQAKAYYDIGTKAKIDVMTAEYNLGKAKLDHIKSKNNIALAYAQVNNAMGLPEYSNYSISDKLDTWSYSVNFDEIIQKAYESRPELVAAKKKAEGSELLIRASKRAFAPNINAFGNYTLGGKTPGHDYGYQLGAGLNYTSTNLMLLKKQVDEAKATYKKDLADYETQKQSVYLDVKQAYIQLYNAQDSIPVAKLSMEQAKEQYDLASGRYKVGLGDAIELKDAENTYRNAQLDYYRTLLDYNVAAANIERVIGSPINHTDKSLL